MLALEINNFSKTYNKAVAVSDLSLQISHGSILGLLGPNGAGKTTTINYIAGIIQADKGELNILGHKISQPNYEYKRQVGFVLEKPMFYNKLTGNEYLSFCGQMQGLHKNDIEERIKEIMELFDLKEKANKYIETYSQGMKKKISLAAAIIHSPQMLILDEPFEGIDPVSTQVIMQNLIAMKMKGKSVLISSHILSIIEKIGTEIVIIDKGVIVYKGKIESKTTGDGDKSLLYKSSVESLYDQYLNLSEDLKIFSWL